MKTDRWFGITILLMVMTVLLSTLAFAQAVPVTIDEVQVDDVTLTPNAPNPYDFERGQVMEIEVRFTPQMDLEDAEIEAKISFNNYSFYIYRNYICFPQYSVSS